MLALATAAVAASLTLTPANGGSAHRPQGHRLTAKVQITVPPDQDRPVVTGLELWYGRGVELHRDRVPACSIATISHGGPDACPAKSIMGHSGGIDLDPVGDPTPTFTFVNGPDGRLIAYTVLQRPARVRAPAVSKVFENPRSRFPFRDAWKFPRVLQKVAGIPVSMRNLKLTFGGKSWAKDYISTTGCPRGGWAWRVRVHFRAAGFQDVNGRAPCRR